MNSLKKSLLIFGICVTIAMLAAHAQAAITLIWTVQPSYYVSNPLPSEYTGVPLNEINWALTPDHEAVNDAIGNQNHIADAYESGEGFFNSDNLLVQLAGDGKSEGIYNGDNFTAWDEFGNIYGDNSEDSGFNPDNVHSIRFCLENVSLITDPFYITVKSGDDKVDVYEWTDGYTSANVDEDGIVISYNYCMATDEFLSVSGSSISHIALVGQVVPEPASIAVWSVLSLMGLGLVVSRRKHIA